MFKLLYKFIYTKELIGLKNNTGKIVWKKIFNFTKSVFLKLLE